MLDAGNTLEESSLEDRVRELELQFEDTVYALRSIKESLTMIAEILEDTAKDIE